jgi:HSP20 family protein
MRRDDRDDPFDEFFEEIERMMNEMMGTGGEFRIEGGHEGGRGGVHVDTHETDESVRVVADLPGVEKADIDLKCDGSTLHLNAAGADREYHDRIDLPARVDEHSANATYNNGILEVTFDRADESTSIDI